MKTKLLLSIFTLLTSLYMAAQYQTNVSAPNEHYHDINQTIINDGTDDIMVASNLFDPTMTTQVISLKRIDQNGIVVWARKYDALPLVNARIFDIENRFDLVYITGSVDVSGIKRVFIAEIEAATGIVLNTQYYDIVSPNFNSRGLHIAYTESDADGDGTPDAGFVVSGFFSDCYNLDTTCNANIGFVLRTDTALNFIWATEVDTGVPATADYDFVNRVTETSDGYFLTGSATGLNGGGGTQQGVLAHKINFLGSQVWDNSYIFGNSQDVSVDAYYDAGTNEIYALVNYSVSHYFGITVFNNSTGAINPTKSWYGSASDLDRYGFSLMESLTSPNNLVIAGYDRDENWIGGAGTSLFGQSNVFVYEFDKATGNPVGLNYQYLVPHTEPTGDEFNFWNGQMPLIYYPEMSFVHRNATGTVSDYFHVGYRRNTSASFTATELYKTDFNKRNQCQDLLLNIVPVGISTFIIQVSSAVVPVFTSPLALNMNGYNYNEDLCDPTLSTGDQEIETGVIYPNPVNDTLFTTFQGAESYIVYDAMGRKVAQGTLDASRSITVESLISGMYFITISNENGQDQTFRFIKN